MTKTIVTLFIFLFFGQIAYADYETGRPGDLSQPTKVFAGIVVLDFDKVDTSEQSFVGNIFYGVKWTDKRLAHNNPEPIKLPISNVWVPHVQIYNQQRLQKTFPEDVVEVSPDGEVYFRQRVWGSFSQPLTLNDFPFDTQKFNIQLVLAGYTPQDIELLRDDDKVPNGIAAKLSLPDWRILNWEAGSNVFKILPGSKGMASYTFTVEAQREVNYFIIKVILPLILIVFMSWVVFWIKPKETSPRISIAVTSMLTLIAYRFAIGADVPKLPYLTRLDFFVMAATLLVFAGLIEVVISSIQEKRGNEKIARKIDIWSRWLFPVVFLIVIYKTLLLGIYL